MRPPHVQAVLAALSGVRNRYTSEAALQSAIGRALTAAGIESIRERRLTSKDRVDFHVPGLRPVGIEVKVKGGKMAHLRQLYRYAPHYADLILVTTQASCPEDQVLQTGPSVWAVTPPGDPPAKPHFCNLHVVNISLRL